jgi:hypothetical protein
MEITKVEYRSVIKFLRLEGNSPKQIYERLVGVYGDSVPSFRTVIRWFNSLSVGTNRSRMRVGQVAHRQASTQMSLAL